MRKYSGLFFAVIVMCMISCSMNRKMTKSGTDLYRGVAVEGQKGLFRSGNVYIGGQPDKERLQWLSERGVTVIVNTRTVREMEKHKKKGFDQKEMVEKLGMKYVQIPLSKKDSYNPAAVEMFHEALGNGNEKACLHCFKGSRACWLWTAYLVKYKGLSIDEAFAIGKSMKIYFPLENLLGRELTMTID